MLLIFYRIVIEMVLFCLWLICDLLELMDYFYVVLYFSLVDFEHECFVLLNLAMVVV